MIQNDTIVALASPSGSGAIAVIRVSGAEAISICKSVFSSVSGKDISKQKSHTLHLGHVVDGNKITLINKTTTDISGCKLKIRDKNGGDIIVDVTTIYDNKIFYINGDITQGISCMDICGTNLDEYTKDGVTTYKRGSQVYTGEVKKGIFVYGIQVDDFHTLDKDTIWTVTLSATKELDTQLQLANSKIADLEQTVRRQQADIDAIKLRLG